MWIARTGGATSGEASEIKDLPLGLLDVPASDRTNWRELANAEVPAHDRNIEFPVMTAIPIAAGGNASVTWSLVKFATAERVNRLIVTTDIVAADRLSAARITIFNRPLEVSDSYVSKLAHAQLFLEKGWVLTVRLIAADGSTADATLAQVETALNAIADYRALVSAAQSTIWGQVRDGTITTTAQVEAHAAWPPLS